MPEHYQYSQTFIEFLLGNEHFSQMLERILNNSDNLKYPDRLVDGIVSLIGLYDKKDIVKRDLLVAIFDYKMIAHTTSEEDTNRWNNGRRRVSLPNDIPSPTNSDLVMETLPKFIPENLLDKIYEDFFPLM